jgi:hypothetical protein
MFLLPLSALALPSSAHPPHTLELQVDSPESDVIRAVQAVTEDQIIHGTYSYEKEKILMGAHPADSSAFFREWKDPGKVFYKIDENVLAPRYFEDSGDIGTITVRYVVRPVSATATDLRIDAVFVDARHFAHWSEGGVESAEYGAVLQQLRQLQAVRKTPAPSNESSSRIESFTTQPRQYHRSPATNAATGAVSAEQEMQQRVDDLRHQLERRVKANGATLKSAPFRSASTVEKLPANSEVLLLIVTQYWYGIETENGHHGWIHHSELEPLP